MRVKTLAVLFALTGLPHVLMARQAVDAPHPPQRPRAVAKPSVEPPEQFGPPMPSATQGTSSLCLERLKDVGATFSVPDPATMLSANCAVASPVRLQSIAAVRKAGIDLVQLHGEPLLACETALAVTQWVQASVAPLARGHFDQPLLEIAVGGGWECRRRNHQSSEVASEHAYGRALDIMSFRTATRMIKVEKSPAEDVRPFLDAVWASGCGYFSTVLGPNADAFHATHIHVDLQPRRSAASRYCQ